MNDLASERQIVTITVTENPYGLPPKTYVRHYAIGDDGWAYCLDRIHNFSFGTGEDDQRPERKPTLY